MVLSLPIALFSYFLIFNTLISDNNFNRSHISSHFSHFSNLVHLNLRKSNFVGQVPSEISHLSKLVSLSLSFNFDLSIEPTTFTNLARNLTMLRKLEFRYVNLSFVSPVLFMKLSSSLSSLDLWSCGLSGRFPGSILQRRNLRLLSLGWNENITGFLLPTSNWSDSLRYLDLSRTKIPIDFVSNLNSLEKLGLRDCNFVGQNLALLGNLTHLKMLHLSPNDFKGMDIPSSFGNLVNLTSLDLSSCNFSGEIPSSLGNLKQLVILDLWGNNLNGNIPSSFENLKQLYYLSIGKNNLSGYIPSFFGNFTKLSTLDLFSNNLHGHIPSSLSYLVEIFDLDLSNNNLNGHIPSSLGNLAQLGKLYLFNNNLSGLIPISFGNLTQLQILALENNQLIGPIPFQLGALSSLIVLHLFNNLLNGSIPNSLFTIPSLNYLDLHNNLLTGQIFQFHHNSSIKRINLRNNMLHGPIPSSIYVVDLEILILSSNNKLTGQLSSSICKLQNLEILDLSNNSLSGSVPKCLGNFSNRLEVLHLGLNYFNGTIPQTFSTGNFLRYINFYNNEFQGQIPRSIINCRNLEFVDLGHNKIIDTFPSFLGDLSRLKVLVLRSNKLHGLVNNFTPNNSFSSLRIFDLSNNNLSGPLPSEYFDCLEAMMMTDSGSHYKYMGEEFKDGFDYHVKLTFKGLEIVLVKIQNIFINIDFSENEFTGKIPETIGKLKALIHLNLSHNCLDDYIPPSLGNLTNLESLDLSSNLLVGRIPIQLLDLKFLAVFNVSYNQLEGSIPSGKQFDTFENNSYKGNWGLCGFPLTKECNEDETQRLNPSKEELLDFDENGFGWEAVAVGYGCGVIFGIGIGFIIFKTRKRSWFVRMIKAEGYLWRMKFDKLMNARKEEKTR